MTKNQFIEALHQTGVDLTDRQIAQFEQYMKLLQQWNEKMNLTAITEENEVWEKHFYDSILPFASLRPTSMCDVGSGAGFPGIPVKIAFPDCDMTLLEPLQKRCRFLSEVVDQLGLQKVTIANARAEDYVKEHREFFSNRMRAGGRQAVGFAGALRPFAENGWNHGRLEREKRRRGAEGGAKSHSRTRDPARQRRKNDDRGWRIPH